jgi:hypothetical protein
VFFLGAAGFRGGWTAVAIAAVVIGIALPGALALLVLANRRHGNNYWPATMPVWALQQAGASMRSGLQPESELLGHVSLGQQQVIWTPHAGAARVGATQLAWPVAGASVTRIRGILSPGHLRVVDAQGRTADVWVRDPRDLARRLAG